MKVALIEDERLTAEDLRDVLLHVRPGIEVTAILASVKESVAYFRTHPAPDLIFSDIQLGDGLSFEIFQQVDLAAPVVFCTAYNEYALNAFQANGIHYILKPFDRQAIADALNKYDGLKASMGGNANALKDLQALFSKATTTGPSSLLVYRKDRIIPVKLDDIALFYIRDGVTRLSTFDGGSHSVDKTLGELEPVVGPSFYRANRQFLVNKLAVDSVAQRLSRKATLVLTVPFPEPITISKEKITELLEWLGS